MTYVTKLQDVRFVNVHFHRCDYEEKAGNDKCASTKSRPPQEETFLTFKPRHKAASLTEQKGNKVHYNKYNSTESVSNSPIKYDSLIQMIKWLQ